MAHELDITEGQASFVSARQDAWHALGVTLPDSFTAEEAMEHGLLGDWNVRKAPTFTEVDGQRIETPDRFAVVRDNPVTPGKIDVIGNVGPAYVPIQNEAHAEFLNRLVDDSGAIFETAGALRGGSQVFITMKMPGISLPEDPIEQYIAAINSHDGSSSFTIMVTPIRIVCANTLNFALNGARNTFKIRHTSGSDKAITQSVRETLGITFDYIDEFEEEARRLMDTTMTQIQFEEMITSEFGVPDDAPAATITRAENKIESMFRLYADAYTQEGIRDTAWAGVNALAEWFDHFAPVRGENEKESRALNTIGRSWQKDKAMEMVKSFVG